MKLDAKIATGMRQRHKLPETADVRALSAVMSLKDLGEEDPYKFTARITTDALDRQDEVVLPEGGQFGEFLSSGAVFWNHQYETPVGFPDKGKRILRGENFVEAGGIFMKRPENYSGEFFPDFVRAFVTQGIKAGINPGVSIGFIPVESRRPSKADVQKYGDRIQLVHCRWKLLELSIAPVPANQEAVIIAVGKGLIQRDVAKAVGMNVPDAPPAPPKLRKVIKCSLVMPCSVNLEAVAEHEVRKAVYRHFGRAFLPSS